MMRAIKFCIAIAPVLGGLFLLQAICATEVTFSKGEVHLSWSIEQEVFKIEKASFLGNGSWELIASEVSGGAFSISSSDSEAFFRITRLGRRSEVPVFGCDLDSVECLGPSLPPWCFGARSIGAWDEPRAVTEPEPLKFDFWQGPYQNKSGYDAVARINNWFAAGTAAGLGQDAFRSFDLGHSSIRDFYPQLNRLDPVASYDAECRDVFSPGVTFGVQSLAASADSVGVGLPVIDFNSATEILYHYNRAEYRRLVGAKAPVFTRAFYRQFFESNVLIVSPAVKSFVVGKDEISD